MITHIYQVGQETAHQKPWIKQAARNLHLCCWMSRSSSGSRTPRAWSKRAITPAASDIPTPADPNRILWRIHPSQRDKKWHSPTPSVSSGSAQQRRNWLMICGRTETILWLGHWNNSDHSTCSDHSLKSPETACCLHMVTPHWSYSIPNVSAARRSKDRSIHFHDGYLVAGAPSWADGAPKAWSTGPNSMVRTKTAEMPWVPLQGLGMASQKESTKWLTLFETVHSHLHSWCLSLFLLKFKVATKTCHCLWLFQYRQKPIVGNLCRVNFA